MISVNSNCSRIDAVKATSHQLEMQVEGAPRKIGESESYRKAQNRIEALKSEIKAGDARKAELALSTASSAVQQLRQTSSETSRHLDTYA